MLHLTMRSGKYCHSTSKAHAKVVQTLRVGFRRVLNPRQPPSPQKTCCSFPDVIEASATLWLIYAGFGPEAYCRDLGIDLGVLCGVSFVHHVR